MLELWCQKLCYSDMHGFVSIHILRRNARRTVFDDVALGLELILSIYEPKSFHTLQCQQCTL